MLPKPSAHKGSLTLIFLNLLNEEKPLPSEAGHSWREVRFTDYTVREAEKICDGVKAKQGIKNIQLIEGQKGVMHVYITVTAI